jgi:hypothetical protein
VWGGSLYLTLTYLFFVTHSLNKKQEVVKIALSDIVEIGKAEKMLGLQRLIWVRDKNNNLYEFVVWKRNELIKAIEEQRTASMNEQKVKEELD